MKVTKKIGKKYAKSKPKMKKTQDSQRNKESLKKDTEDKDETLNTLDMNNMDEGVDILNTVVKKK